MILSVVGADIIRVGADIVRVGADIIRQLFRGGTMLLKISKNISLVLSETGFTYCNCLFIDDKVKTIIDTGADLKSLAEIDPPSVDRVINTHHHFDHTRGNKFFTNAKISIHQFDAEPLSDAASFEYYNSFDLWNDLMPEYDYVEAARGIGLDEENFADIWGVDQTFTDGELIDLGKYTLQVIHTPGHSKGHCCFWFPEQQFLFSGDICLTAAGPWYGEVLSDPTDMIESIDKLIALKPTTMASCHIKKVCTDCTERLTEFKDRIYKREERIYNYLKHNAADVDKIAGEKFIYRFHPSPFVLFWEKLMVMKHLNRLLDFDRIEEIDQGLYRAK